MTHRFQLTANLTCEIRQTPTPYCAFIPGLLSRSLLFVLRSDDCIVCSDDCLSVSRLSVSRRCRLGIQVLQVHTIIGLYIGPVYQFKNEHYL